MGILLCLCNIVPGVGWVFDEDGAVCVGHLSSRATQSNVLIREMEMLFDTVWIGFVIR